MSVEIIKVKDLVIEGYKGDYVFETIRKTEDFYEISLLEKWVTFLKNSKVVLDIGANLGNHTMFFSKNMVCEEIYSFEPYLPNYERLVSNIRNNNLNKVKTINKGVGAQKGFTTLANFDESNYGATALNQGIYAEGDIELTDIDSFVVENGLKNIDFVKIDTEGCEESVLTGMEVTIAKFHPDFWIEVSRNSFKNVYSTLKRRGYILVDVIGFNMLFLHADRHDGIKEMDYETLLDSLFHNMERAENHFKNYERSKEWLKAKDAKIQEVENANSKKEQLLAEARKKLEESNQKYKESIKQYETIKEWLKAKDVKMQEVENANSKKEQLLAEAKRNLEETNQKYKEAIKQYETVKEWLKAKDVKIQEVENANSKKEQLLAEAKRNLEASNQKYKESIKQYETVKEWLKAKDVKIQEAEDANSKKEQLLAEAKSNLEEANQKYKESIKQYETVKEWLKAKDVKIQEVENANSKKEQLLAEAKRSLEEANQKYNETIKQYETVKELLKAKDAKLQEVEASTSEKEQQFTEAKKRLEEMQTKRDEHERQYKILQNTLLERENTLKEIQGKYSELMHQYEVVQKAVSETECQVADLTEKLTVANRKYRESNERYDTMKQWLSVKDAKLQELEGNFAISKNEASEAAELLKVFAVEEQHSQLVIQKAKRLIQKQQKEMQLMRVDLENHRRIVSKITNTWYGRVALKCYRMLKKIKILK